VVSLRPEGDHPDRAHAVASRPRVAAILQRVASDVDELARARRVARFGAAAALPDRRAGRRRRVAEPGLDFREFCRRSKLPASSIPQLERAWDAWRAERYQRGEISQRPGYTASPFRPRWRPSPATTHTRAVQEAGRPNAVHDTVVTGTHPEDDLGYLHVPGHDNFHLATQTVTTVAVAAASSSGAGSLATTIVASW